MNPRTFILRSLTDQTMWRGMWVSPGSLGPQAKAFAAKAPGLMGTRITGGNIINVLVIDGYRPSPDSPPCGVGFLFISLSAFSTLELARIVSEFTGRTAAPEDILANGGEARGLYTLDTRDDRQAHGVEPPELTRIFRWVESGRNAWE